MAVDTNRPEVAQLICDVERRFGRSVITRSDFAKLVNCIEDVTSNHISENTLRRLWGRISGYVSVFVHTLDVLAQYVGYEHWMHTSNILRGLIMSSRASLLRPRLSRAATLILETVCVLVGCPTAYVLSSTLVIISLLP